MLFLELVVKPRALQRQTQMDGNRRKKLFGVVGQRPGSVQQLEHSNARSVSIDDRRAIEVARLVTQFLIELWAKPRIRGCIRNIERLTRLRHVARDAGADRQDDLKTFYSLRHE